MVLGGAPRVVGSDGTVSLVRIVSLSPRVENLNLKKVIKVSYLNQESRQCFVFFGFLCVWTFYEHMYISHICIMAMQHQDGNSFKISLNIYKRLEELRIHASVKSLELKLSWKLQKIKYSKCRLCGDRDETINHIISECSKLAQKEYKSRHDWVGKVIHWETCKKFKFDHTNKWYMHNPAPVLENDTHKLLWDFNIPHPGQKTRPYNNQQKKVDFAIPADHRINLKEYENLEVGGRVETIQTIALLKTARILRRVLETWGDLLSLRLQWKTIS